MLGLVVVAWVSFGAAGLSAAALIQTGDEFFAVTAFSAMATGFVFLALDRIVTHLAIIAQAAATSMPGTSSLEVTDASVSVAVRSIEDLSSEIERMKAQHVVPKPIDDIGARNALRDGRITTSKFGKYVVADRQFDTLAEAFANLPGTT